MQLIATDVLTEAKGLSVTLTLPAMSVGVLLWLTGWRWHRFWLVLALTVAGGVAGLSGGDAVGPRLFILGVLLAVAAGVMALELARVLAFAVAGIAAAAAVKLVAPHTPEPMIPFLVGGLAGVMLFRVSIMAASSAAGVLLSWYAAFLTADKILKGFDSVAFAEKHAVWLNLGVGIAAVLGVAVQGMLERRRGTAAKRAKEAEKKKKEEVLSFLSEEERDHLKKLAQKKERPASGGWWAFYKSRKKAA